MYRPKGFSVTEREALHDLVEQASFGHLVSFGVHGYRATGLPFLVDRESGELGALRGHVARANQHWKGLDGADVLVIFQLADGYVSPAWYPSKAEHGRVVPTWNYEVVQVHGRAHVHDDVAWLRTLVSDLTDHHESSRLARDESSHRARPESSRTARDESSRPARPESSRPTRHESSREPEVAADQALRESSRPVRYESGGARDQAGPVRYESGGARDQAGPVRYESGGVGDDAGRPAWAVTDAPADYVDAQLRAIVGVEIEITFLEGARKLSQNRPEADRAGVADALEASAHPRDRRLLDAMRTV